VGLPGIDRVFQPLPCFLGSPEIVEERGRTQAPVLTGRPAHEEGQLLLGPLRLPSQGANPSSIQVHLREPVLPYEGLLGLGGVELCKRVIQPALPQVALREHGVRGLDGLISRKDPPVVGCSLVVLTSEVAAVTGVEEDHEFLHRAGERAGLLHQREALVEPPARLDTQGKVDVPERIPGESRDDLPQDPLGLVPIPCRREALPKRFPCFDKLRLELDRLPRLLDRLVEPRRSPKAIREKPGQRR
jgi:hypothetical protein